MLTLATIDLSGVTGPIGDLSTALVTGVATVIAAALAVAAVIYGGKALWRFFKSMAS